MRSLITIVLFAAVALSALFAARAANANEPPGRRIEVSLLGGVHSVNQNDTAIPDNMAGVPVVGAVSYQLSPNFAAEGEFTWFIPVTQSVDMGGGVSQDRKAPDALAYQVGLRASYPLSTWSPYLAAGAAGTRSPRRANACDGNSMTRALAPTWAAPSIPSPFQGFMETSFALPLRRYIK